MKQQKYAVPIAVMFMLAPILANAAGSEDGVPGRYQIVVRNDMLGQTLFMIDSSTGHTWRLTTVPQPTPEGSPGEVDRWLPLEMGDKPLLPRPTPATAPTRKP
jgi:hypothetical protein